jgi:uncharacterized repeat protein (TIGR03803 family)
MSHPSSHAESGISKLRIRCGACFLFAALLWAAACGAAQGQSYEKVYDFALGRLAETSSKGALPRAQMVQGADGSLYGTTERGGVFDHGTVFKVTLTGELTTLVDFTDADEPHKGRTPTGALVQALDGNFYGTARTGGAGNLGTIFRMTPAGMLATLVEFDGTNGSLPTAGLLQAPDGNFYGTTEAGGVHNSGTLFRLTPAGALTTLVNFGAPRALTSTDIGKAPVAALINGGDGNFYGTTTRGGFSDCGVAYRITPAGAITILVDFTGVGGASKGRAPSAALVRGPDGNFYGTTREGGASDAGTVFRLTSAGVLSTLVEFTGNQAASQGKAPMSPLVPGFDGNLYGTTELGGARDFGTVYRLTPGGEVSTVLSFTGADGSNEGSFPLSGLVRGTNGVFYGTTLRGGTRRIGTIYAITPAGVFASLVEFAGRGAADLGKLPLAALLQDDDGAFYGTTQRGGGSEEGTIFKMTEQGEVTTLIAFDSDAEVNDGGLPAAALIKGSDGNFYGTTELGGANNLGTVFRMDAAGEITYMAEFTGIAGASKGARPISKLIEGSDGSLYGTTREGGAGNFGTVFRITTAGVLSTLAEFTGGGPANRGSHPAGPLLEGADGHFYGTTRTGGANGHGTVFRMSSTGTLSTMVDFTGTAGPFKGSNPAAELVPVNPTTLIGSTELGGASDSGTLFTLSTSGAFATVVELTGNGPGPKGKHPVAALARGPDGAFYGTTRAGGSTDRGTVFKLILGGAFSTLWEFPHAGSGLPVSRLTLARDGNFYGSTVEGDGTIFRLVLPGAPTVLVTNVEPQTDSARVLIEAQVNARGSITQVSVEYRRVGDSTIVSVPLISGLVGFQTVLTGTSLTELLAGEAYEYRIRAQSSAGTTLTDFDSFTTLAEPRAFATAASGIAPMSAQFNGLVNPRNLEASVIFQWGDDGSTFPNTVTANPALVSGGETVEVNAAVAGLETDRTYYYRIVATSEGGIAVSGTQSFRTLIEPLSTVTGAFGLNTTSARVFGSVDARGSDSDVVFEYGADGISFPNAVAAEPAEVTGQGAIAVSATLANLSQGTTYHFRVRATSAGGVGLSEVGTFDLGVLSGFAQVAPALLDPRSNAQGFLVVNLMPSGIGEGWRFVGEQSWRASGVPAGGLATGDREIEYRPVPGFLHPLREPVSIVSGAAATVVEREYFAGAGGATGSLTVTLLPAALGAAAQWRFLGEGEDAWLQSGAVRSGLAAGVYLVEGRDVDGFSTPRPISVTVDAGESKTATGTYFLADAPVGAQPEVVGFDAVVSAEANPYTYVGQLRSDAGAGTGFVVRPRVVCTAAHVVFDDGTLSPATGLQWLFQRESGSYEPVPQVPRGSYILSGYSAQRTADASPGASSSASQNLDVASVWFFEEDAARGGFGGYLASDANDNEWLLSARLKTIVGYPLDDVVAADQGRMHATPPMNVAFSKANGRVYLTEDVTSRGGNSGGPVCVQYDDGRYYPAAVYLGGATQTRVRVIDGDVIVLFDSAEESGNTGENSTNGGIPQLNSAVSAPASGTLTVTIEPAGARTAGAGWRIGSGDFAASGQTKPFLSPGSYTVSFASVAGYQTPSARNAVVNGSSTTNLAVTYVLAVPPLITGPGTVRLVRGQAAAFDIEVENGASFYAVAGLDASGLSLNSSSGRISGTPLVNGTYQLTATAQNTAGGSAPFVITVIVSDPGTLAVQADPTRGSVKVSPRFPGNVIPQGETMTLKAKASEPQFLFGGWEFAGLVEPPSSSTAAEVSFVMTESVTATARFVPNPYLVRKGSFYGLLEADAGFEGSIIVKVARTGRFTLKVVLPGLKGSFTGRLDAYGRFAGVLQRRGGETLPVDITLDVGADEPRLTGTATVNNISYAIDAARSAFGRAAPAPYAGRHTFLLPPDAAQADAAAYPQGFGHGVMSVKSSGRIKATGYLADGTRISMGGFLRVDGTWALALAPHRGGGTLAGVLHFADHPAPELDEIAGVLRWVKPAGVGGTYPAGFSGSRAVVGSEYRAPVDGELVMAIDDWALAIGEGVLASPIGASATLGVDHRLTLAPAEAASMRIKPGTGEITGSFFTESDAEATALRGVVLQRQQTAAGHFALPDRAGAFSLVAP